MITKEQYLEIRRCHKRGMTANEIATKVGVSAQSVRKWWKIDEKTFDEHIDGNMAYLDNYREFILNILRLCPQTRQTNILYRLQEEFPDFHCHKQTFYRYMRMLREQTGFEQFNHRNTSPREESPPGYEAQVDFGQFKMMDMYGKDARVYFFCMVLAYSRMHYLYFSREPFTTSEAIKAHEYAFLYFGGRPQTILYDQDRVFVVDENFGNIVLVKAFEEFARNTGFSVRLCRPHDPQSKGKVESFVRYVKESFLTGRIYTGIDNLNSSALRWLDNEGNGTTNLRTRKPPRELFREEQRHLEHFSVSKPETSMIRSVSDKFMVTVDWSNYELPHSKVKPFDQVRIEDEFGILLFYKASSNELIYKCKKRKTAGVTPAGEQTEKLDFVASNSIRYRFAGYEVIDEFMDKLSKTEARYKNVQFNRIITLANLYTDDMIAEAMEYCVKVGRCNVSEITAFLIFRCGEEMARKKLSKEAFYNNRKRAEEIRREQDGKYF